MCISLSLSLSLSLYLSLSLSFTHVECVSNESYSSTLYAWIDELDSSCVPHPSRSQYFFLGLGAANSGLPMQSPCRHRKKYWGQQVFGKGDFGTYIRRLEVYHRRCAMAGVSFSMLSLGWFLCQQHVQTSAGKAEAFWGAMAHLWWHTYNCPIVVLSDSIHEIPGGARGGSSRAARAAHRRLGDAAADAARCAGVRPSRAAPGSP